jgi:hypothetical protein
MSLSNRMTLRQATVRQSRDITILETTRLPLSTGQARIAVDCCGVCGSDLTMYKGNHPVMRSSGDSSRCQDRCRTAFLSTAASPFCRKSGAVIARLVAETMRVSAAK